jgi:hypothetical protein
MRNALIPIVILFLVAGCTSSAKKAPEPATLAWHRITLPTDPRGRDMVRAVTACAGHWYVAGGVLAKDGTTAPALWASSNGTSFTALPIAPTSAYGPSHVLSSVACRGADVVAVGASSGGAHGNPRTNTWLSRGGGPLTEAPFTFELYGGSNAVGVGRVRAGDAGYLIVGARIDAKGGGGAAVWQSPDGTGSFTLIDNDPALESDSRGATEVDDSVVLPGGYLAVGGITPTGSHLAARDPLAWRSTGGRTWTRIGFPTTSGDDLLERVTATTTGVLAAGPDADGFAVWSGDPSGVRWRRVAHFGATVSGSAVPAVADLVEVGSAGSAYAVVSDAAEFQLWRGTGADWQRVTLPVAVPAGPTQNGPRVVSAAASGGTLMLGVDDGNTTSVWTAPVG